MSILTVGSGEQFATIAAAVAAAHAGDTIDVNAGTYTAGDLMITKNLTLTAVGGTVDVVAPVSPTKFNVGKGLFIVGNDTSNPNVTIEGFSFSGASASSSNGAGIRYQSGNLTLDNDSFSNNQDGLLATPFVFGTGTIEANGCVFNHNGAGDGQSHNIYVGYINTFVLTDSLSENAVVGHEVKTRAMNNVIEDNQILDGPTGTASYSIDLPNDGNDIVQGNTIEKGPKASSPIAIHVGGPILPYLKSNVVIEDNTFINDYGPAATVVSNEFVVPVRVTGNTIEGFNNILRGIGTQSGNVTASGTAIAASTNTSPGLPGSIIDLSGATGAQSVTVTRPDLTVVGGSGLLTVLDQKAQTTVFGGYGGVAVSGLGSQTVYTNAGSTNTIQASSGGNVYFSLGNDSVSVASGGGTHYDIYGTATVNGSATTTASEVNAIFGVENFTARGAAETFMIRPGGTANVSGASSFVYVEETGGTENFNFTLTARSEVLGGTIIGGDVEMTNTSMTIYQSSSPATIELTQGNYKIIDVNGSTIGNGAATVYVSSMAGAGRLTFIGGSGLATVNTSSGGALISVGAGNLDVNEHPNDGAVVYDLNAAIGGGTVQIADFRSATDTINFSGFSGNPIVSQSVVGGSLHMALQNHTTIVLEHVTKL